MPGEKVAIRLPEAALESLTDLVRNRDQLLKIMDAAHQTRPAASIRGFSVRVAAECRLSVADVRDTLSALLNLYRLQTYQEVDAEKLVALVTESLDRYAEQSWKSTHLNDWKSASHIFVNALSRIHDDSPLLVSDKADTLAYSYENLLVSSRVITDVRPVYDAAGARILETVVGHTLLIQYADSSHSSGYKRIAFALDASDIADLKTACERAETKAHTALKDLASLNPIIIPDQGSHE